VQGAYAAFREHVPPMTPVYLGLALTALVLLLLALRMRTGRDAEPAVTRVGTLQEIKEQGRRRKQEVPSTLAAPDEVAAVAGAPDPVPTPAEPGPVNINTASLEELMQLPGVGRRAATRIVEHRDRHGPFGSLDELAAIDGFHQERIQRLADQAEI
jgi:competence ComEA-like helix-hairpin-helix protein